MGIGYQPYQPLFELKPVAPEIWIADGAELRMRLGFVRFPFPTRMTIVRVPWGIWLHSPIAPEDHLVSQIARLGLISDIVAPNNLHHTWTAAWSKRFPDARVWVSPGIDARALAGLRAHRPLTEEPPREWQGAFDQVILSSDPVTEVDFYHKETHSLILTDAIENLDLRRFKSSFFRFLAWAVGSADPDGKLPWELRQYFKSNRKSNRAAVDRMLGWKPERILLAHGRWYDQDGTKELKRGFRWL